MIVPYQFVNPEKEGDPAHLFILGDIVEGAWVWKGEESPITLLDKIKGSGATELVCHIDSYGGVTSAGIAMYNLLRSCEAKVTTIAEGFCASAASLVFMAGDKRIMRNASLLMIHNAWSTVAGNAEELRKTADDLEDEKLEALLAAESWIDPEEAVEWGFATGIAQDEEQKNEAYSSAFQSIRNALRTEQEQPKTAFQKYFKNFLQ